MESRLPGDSSMTLELGNEALSSRSRPQERLID